MTRLVSTILAAMILSGMTASLASAQEKKGISPGGVDWCGNSWGLWRADEKYLLNLPSSPLTLTVEGSSGDLLLTNKSNKQVVSYRLGHYLQKKDGLKSIRVSDLIKIDLHVNEMLINPTEGIAQEIEFTRAKKAKIAVIEVTFSGGSVWKGEV